jgi:hypothetical protein
MPTTAHGRHRLTAPPTFTSWRVLVLILIGPIAALAVLTGIYLAPGGPQLFGATVHPGELPVVAVTPGVTR